jgi:hypothetical protein
MSLYQERFTCEYVDASLRPADDMLYKCVQDPKRGYDFYCQDTGNISDRKNTSYTDDLGILRGYATSGQHSSQGDTKNVIRDVSVKPTGGEEGFANMFVTDNGPGKSTIRNGQCPEGYTRTKNGDCRQVCFGCSYRDNMRSKEFNEYDPCFPEGVYDGTDKYGDTICTCGSENKYCSHKFTDQFTADGNMIVGLQIKNTIGLTDRISKLFDMDSL